MTRAYERIKVARAGPVETITLALPAKRNAIGPRMTNEILWALEDARAAEDAGLARSACRFVARLGSTLHAVTDGCASGSSEPLALARIDRPYMVPSEPA